MPAGGVDRLSDPNGSGRGRCTEVERRFLSFDVLVGALGRVSVSHAGRGGRPATELGSVAAERPRADTDADLVLPLALAVDRPPLGLDVLERGLLPIRSVAEDIWRVMTDRIVACEALRDTAELDGIGGTGGARIGGAGELDVFMLGREGVVWLRKSTGRPSFSPLSDCDSCSCVCCCCCCLGS